MADYPAACPGVFATETLVVGPSFGSPDVWALSDGTDACISTDLSNWQALQKCPRASSDMPCPTSWSVHAMGPLPPQRRMILVVDGSFQWLSLDGTHWALLRSALDALDCGRWTSGRYRDLPRMAGLLRLEARSDSREV